jgi:hypothetical protein
VEIPLGNLFSYMANVLFLGSSLGIRSNNTFCSAALDDNVKPEDETIDNTNKKAAVMA